MIFETDEYSQVIAKYLESKLQMDLFPPMFDGLQKIQLQHNLAWHVGPLEKLDADH